MRRRWYGPLCLRSSFAATVVAFILVLAPDGVIDAQGITTAAIRGTVTDATGSAVDVATVTVRDTGTGFVTSARMRQGVFAVYGLTSGVVYSIGVARIGYAPRVVDSLVLSLGETRTLRLTLDRLPNEIDTVRISANSSTASLSAGGVSTAISDSSLRRLPSLNRDLYDFVRLVPQVGTRYGLSAAGANFRFNNYMIDGVSDRQLQGNNVMGAGTAGGKTIPLDAIREYQVLVSPYAVRYGNSTGMTVNAVTKSGTNQLHGSTFAYARNAGMARPGSFAGGSDYSRKQFGLSLGGPVVRDRMLFFVAAEWQHAVAPAPGPYLGRDVAGSPTLPIADADVLRFASLLEAKGIDAGDGGRVTIANPAMTLFGRLDLSLPKWKSRMILLETYSVVEVDRFARPDAARVFQLSSSAWTLSTSKHSTSVQILTQLRQSVFNEFLVAYLDRPVVAGNYAASPSIQALVRGANGTTSVALFAGPPPPAGGTGSTQRLAEISDHIVYQAGRNHTIGAGVRAEFFDYHPVGLRGMFGLWTFPNLDALERGEASSYVISRNLGSAEAKLRGEQSGAYLADEWRVGDNLNFTFGIRGDVLSFARGPEYNPAVDSALGRRTSDFPGSRVQWSPRIGFTWRLGGERGATVRGGAGIFVASPPLGWLLGPMRSTGIGVQTLTCNSERLGSVPVFVADPERQPMICADGRGLSPGPVALVDRNLRMSETFRTSLSVDKRLPWNIEGSVEALYSKVRSDFAFINADLAGPQGVDANGRVLYGSIDPSGRVAPTRLSGNRFSEVVDIRNHSLGYSWSATAQATRPFTQRAELRASYTYAKARDVQSLTNQSAVAPFDTWAGGRFTSTRHDVLTTGVSAFDLPHRVVFAATYVAPWRRWKTDFSIFYIGESGNPFTYGDSTSNRLGDLNADGSSANDPIYIPRDARNPAEMVFAGADSADQGKLFEQFIGATPCLRRQRGSIAGRNSCRASWVNTSNASIRQSLQPIGGRGLTLQVDVFNLLNLLNSSWGLVRTPNPWILEHIGQTNEASSRPLFRFDSDKVSSTHNLESGYQVQFSIRYDF